MIQVCSLGVLVLLLTAGILPISADETTAKAKYMSGLQKLENDDYEGAVKDFEASYEEHPNPNCLHNLAVCYFKLDRLTESLAAFERLKALFSVKLDKSDIDNITSKVETIRDRLPSLSISTTPEGAIVVVDGENRGETPLEQPILLSRGEHQVTLSLKGWETITRTISIESGQHLKESFILKRPFGTLTVRVDEPGATVYVDGAPMGTSPLARPLSLQIGPHKIKVKKIGYNAEEATVDVTASTSRTLDMRLLPVVVPRTRIDVPWYKKSSTRLIIGLAGTGVMAGLSTGFWAATFKKRNDHDEKNAQLDPDEGGNWDTDIAADRNDDKNAAKKYNNVAIVSTALTGAFIAATATEFLLGIILKKKGRETISWSPNGVEVAF